MAIERKADTSTKVVASGAPAPRSAANSQSKQPRSAAGTAAGKTPAAAKSAAAKPATSGATTPKVAQLRADLSAARRDLALNKLDSPAKIRQLRKDLARTLTAERAKTAAKEAA